jgi:hypothetical protein
VPHSTLRNTEHSWQQVLKYVIFECSCLNSCYGIAHSKLKTFGYVFTFMLKVDFFHKSTMKYIMAQIFILWISYYTKILVACFPLPVAWPSCLQELIWHSFVIIHLKIIVPSVIFVIPVWRLLECSTVVLLEVKVTDKQTRCRGYIATRGHKQI